MSHQEEWEQMTVDDNFAITEYLLPDLRVIVSSFGISQYTIEHFFILTFG